ncbi:TRAP transporter, 4TM/12TM fusion protein [Ehrlichia ruminantium]|uniref:TRAP transporter, 4TM/12TM fusion protein n=1 Tax=Ehrlichia ruminantium TaxID=779 RepID=A0A170TF60_EHRRU|nr:TRAP transporter, 4TM/12TM fusion protein [Ehrlichia ruminantium]GAT77652.1 TRAP transporter, 4TM/12TM fusion protein [Ehrlichia ruminantium]GAT78823.1 TRAP transporter, 4TM/12TM fusion protein [Ehrlichia ruminantium]
MSISTAMKGYFIKRNKLYESIMLLVIEIMFIRQNYITNLIVHPLLYSYQDILLKRLTIYTE